MMQPHNQQRHRKANSQIHQPLPPLLPPRRIQIRIINIQHHSQRTRDSQRRGRNAHGDGPGNLDFDVAEDLAVPPVGEVVVGPDEHVDEDHEVEEAQVED
ncbi:hypothetical protein O988_09470 [Pseudogymnoascus sp. VKM F-3808]|nr:hypothetical protein O988_09470 [Pseudogymnoascus sp. VKM F-3808]